MNEKEARKELEKISSKIAWLWKIRKICELEKSSWKKPENISSSRKLLTILILGLIFALAFTLSFFYMPFSSARPTSIELIILLIANFLFFTIFFIFSSKYDNMPECSIEDIDCAIERLEKDMDRIYEMFPDIIEVKIPAYSEQPKNRRKRSALGAFLAVLVFYVFIGVCPLLSVISYTICIWVSIIVYYLIYRYKGIHDIDVIKSLCMNGWNV